MSDRLRYRLWNKVLSGMWVDCVNVVVESDGMLYDVRKDEWVCDDIILMQCTGLRDKNGVLIFEGDIINLSVTTLCDPNNRHGGVKWVIRPFEVKYLGQSYTPSYLNEGAIIGNIYENKELLDGES